MLIHGGSFMLKIALLVILTPFFLTFVVTLHNLMVSDDCKVHPTENFMYATDGAVASQVQPTAESNEQTNLFWSVYYNFIDPGSEYIIANNGGKVWAIVVALFGMFLLNGLLVSTMVGYIDSRKDNWMNGKMRYSASQFLFKKFAVVIGANEMAPTIIRNLLCGRGEGRVYYVVLLTNEDVEKVRSVIESYLTKEEEARLIIYNGQLDSKEEISHLHLEWATEIYVLGEDSHEDVSESYHDVQNMRCVHNIANYLEGRGVDREIVCRVMFEFQTTYSVFLGIPLAVWGLILYLLFTFLMIVPKLNEKFPNNNQNAVELYYINASSYLKEISENVFQIVNKYNSQKEIQRLTGFNQGNIGRSIKTRSCSYGYFWVNE